MNGRDLNKCCSVLTPIWHSDNRMLVLQVDTEYCLEDRVQMRELPRKPFCLSQRIRKHLLEQA